MNKFHLTVNGKENNYGNKYHNLRYKIIMKKSFFSICSLILATLFLINTCITTTTIVYAADAEISFENVSVNQGDTVDIDLTLTNCPDIKSFCLYDFVCDSPDVKIEAGTWKLNFAIIRDNLNLETNDAVIAYTKNTDCNGKIFSISVKADENAKPGKYSISCSAVAKYKEEQGNEISVPITIKPAVLEIVANEKDTESSNIDDIFNDIDNNIIISAVDKVISENEKNRVDELDDDEINIVIKDIKNQADDKNLAELDSLENKQEFITNKYYEAQYEVLIENTLTVSNAQAIKKSISSVLNEMGVENVNDLEKGQKSAFVSKVLSEFEKRELKTIDFPESFNDNEKASAIEVLYEKSIEKSNNIKWVIIVAIMICVFTVIAVIIVVRKRKN